MRITKSDKMKLVKIEDTRDGMYLGLKISEHANWISYPVTEKHLTLLEKVISDYFQKIRGERSNYTRGWEDACSEMRSMINEMEQR